jgi:hypothetical protein
MSSELRKVFETKIVRPGLGNRTFYMIVVKGCVEIMIKVIKINQTRDTSNSVANPETAV